MKWRFNTPLLEEIALIRGGVWLSRSGLLLSDGAWAVVVVVVVFTSIFGGVSLYKSCFHLLNKRGLV